MQLQYLSVLITDNDGAEHLHENLRMTNADDLRAEREGVAQHVTDRSAAPMAFMTLKAWAACARLGITKEPYQVFRNRIVDYAIELRDVDPTQLAGATTSPSPSPESTDPSSSGSPEPTTS